MLKNILFSLLAFSVSLTLQAQEFAALLTGHQEAPSTTTLAEGLLIFTLDGDSLRVTDGSVTNLSSAPLVIPTTGSSVHLHAGYIGQNGGVLLPLDITYDPTDFSAEFDLKAYFIGDNPDLVTALRERRVYVNLHTELWPSGEIRGQMVGDIDNLETIYDAMLYGELENPPVLTDGMGGVMIEMTADSMFVSGSFSLESPLLPAGVTGVHLHNGIFGTNGGIALALNPTLDAGGLTGVLERSLNAFAINPNISASIEARTIYINIHSVDHPSGELRGQLVDYGNNVYYSYVSEISPTPFPDNSLVQRMMIEKVADDNFAIISGSFANFPANLVALTAPFVQLRSPFTGQGLIEFDLDFTVDASGGSGVIPVQGFALNADAVEGLYYRYFCSTGFATPTGTAFLITNGIHHECKRLFHSEFTGSQAIPNTISQAGGNIATEYYTNRIEMTGFVAGLSDTVATNIAGGFHVHDGMVGRSGGIVEGVNFIQAPTFVAILPDRNVYSITPDVAAKMKDRGLYYNIHTPQYPSGEVRGQLLPRANSTYHAILSAGEAVPGAGPSTANGGIMAELFGNRMTVSGSFNDLAGGFNPAIAGGAHLHGNVAGSTGGIVAPLTSFAASGAESGEFFASDNSFALTAGLVDTMLRRGVYANIHSIAVPSGELRGQVNPLATNVLVGKLSPNVTVPYTGALGASTGTGNLHAEVYDSENLIVTGSLNNLSSPIDRNIAGGAHLHNGTVGQTGGILAGLGFTTDMTGTAAVFPVDSNIITLDAAGLATLLSNGIYANVHTTGAPSGAVRAQMLLGDNRYPNTSPDFVFPADGASVDLNSADTSTVATVEWSPATDPDATQPVGYVWQLYVDTTSAPLIQTTASDTIGVSFTFAQLDDLLESLGVGMGASATVYHRVWTTDGNLLVAGDFSEVTFTRITTSSTNQLPEGAVRLVNTLSPRGAELLLDIDGLDAGNMTYRISNMNGQVINEARFDHSGAAQRYTLAGAPSQAGMYVLQVLDAQGRNQSWIFAVN